ncbi:hypothetical protein [Lactiplantibacillus herbarum]|uniref:hypothetical protein n=1 Tax=Lactiplantibacillus herbarum TaxID=1670446 RepID=UPI00064FA0F2|nr:hypothetical protein [Lactiplantibacillus herbarum]
MRKYWQQVLIYTQYFSKVAWDNPGVLIYTVCLPLVFLILNTKDHFFQQLTLTQYANSVIPFIGWMIFTNCLVTVASIGELREQGYLKQYRTLVVNVSVLIVSEAIVNLILLLTTLTLIAGLSSLVFQLPFLKLIGWLWLTLGLAYIPVICYCLPLLAVNMRQKTLNTMVNAISLIIIVGSVAVSNLVVLGMSNIFSNVLSPLYLISNLFRMLTVGTASQYILTYSICLVILIIVGAWSYRHLKILPTEGL